jgi:serine/threonine protein kinase
MATAEQWQQIQELFHAALEKEPAERSTFLENVCAGDESLRREVAWLISAHETEDHFIDSPGYVAAREVLANHHFEPGETLAYYKIEAALGSGGMGEVYLAEDIRLNRKVALKLLPPHFTVNPDRVRRFEREARAASALNHPNIVTIYEIGKSDTTHFIATEFVDGKTLRQLINEKPFTLNETLNVSMQVADALSGAHAAGIVHRDIKPENIMIRRDGYVKILDFGLAKLTEQQTSESDLETPTLLQSNPGLVMGTVHYMSPEQARARNVGVRTDIWSLGIVMYELLAGRVPFTGETSSHVMVSLMEDKLPPLKNHANVPDELDRFVTKALRKNQKERYHTAVELARDLKSFKQRLQQDTRLKEWLKTVPSRKEGVPLPLHKPLTTVSGGSEQEREPLRKKVSLGWTIPVTALVLIAMVVVLSLNRRSTLWSGTSSQTPHLLTTPDRFIQVTKRDGFISAARFAPDGKQIVYSAGFDGKPVELFLTDVEGSESRSYGIQSAALKSVSRSGKIAVLFDFELNWSDGYNGTLAILPPDGGKPEIIGDGIDDAAFAPDGNTLAIIRRGMGEQQLEYPSGQVLHKSEGWMSYPRFSPKGDKIAFFEHPLGDAGGSIIVFDLASGKKINISSDWKFLKGLAWDPNNNEIWFGGGKTTKKQSINAVSLSGELRLNLHEMPGMHARIEDISADGKALIAQGSSNHTTMMIVEGNSATKAIYSQFSFSTSADLSADGKTLLYYEGGFESSDPADGNTVYLRKLDSSENIKLGPGKALALSPDGKSALALQTKPQPQLVILSTSGTEPKTLPNRGMKEYHYASFFPDGRQILFTGIEALEGAMIRSFVQDISTGQVQPLTEEGTTALRVSPDGKRVITLQPDHTFYIQGLGGGEPKEIPGLERDDEPIQWSDDGRAVFVKAAGDFVTKIYRVDLATGQRREWRDIDPPNKVGHVGLEVNPGGILITPDGKVCIYTYWILLQQLLSASIS